ncbi:MAG: outer membrane protein assembly factor BamD [Acidobacteriota bacterium]|nr:outer membrane protein assembly factor BamD [Blastocatellia bacterium]MDW8413820.1 outer membrane protein assembly factor BamD [Acidobacteriota bacterium]
MKRCVKSFVLVLVVLSVFINFACGGRGRKKLTASEVSDEPREGRDRELFQDALKEMKKKRYEQGRLLINTMITTYADSPLLPIAKLTIADSYYREGGTSNLVQAEAEYKDWLQFFPNHELAPQVMLKMAEIHMRQVQTPDREKEHAFLAEKQLLELQRRFPEAAKNMKVQEYIELVQELLAKHDLLVAKFYFERRNAWKATESRCLEIVKKYPHFTEMDVALWYLARAQEEEENTEDAAKHYARIVREFPRSRYRDAAAERLERFGKPVPDPEGYIEERVIQRKSMLTRAMEALFGPSLAVSKDGILLKQDDQLDQEVARLLEQAMGTSISTPTTTRAEVVRQQPQAVSATEARKDAENAPTMKERTKRPRKVLQKD